MNEINKLKEEVSFWKNMTINKINEFDEVKSETEKKFREFNEMLKNPQITQQQKVELTIKRNNHLALTIKGTFEKYRFKQKLEVLNKKYEQK